MIHDQATKAGHDKMHYGFSGGEPTVHPDFIALISYIDNKYINSKWISTSVTSNMSHGEKFWKKFINVSQNFHKITVTASWHREAALLSKNFEYHRTKFAKKCQLLKSYDIIVLINIIMIPETFDDNLEDAKYFSQMGIITILKPITSSDDMVNNGKTTLGNYTISQLAILENGLDIDPAVKIPKLFTRRESSDSLQRVIRGFQDEKDTNPVPLQYYMRCQTKDGSNYYLEGPEMLVSQEFVDFRGWDCEAGQNSIAIVDGPLGTVYRGRNCKDKSLGSLSEGFTLNSENVKCITPICSCSNDIRLLKKRKHDD
jgi:hypothetical protein